MNCNHCSENKEIHDFFKNTCLTCLRCKEEIKKKKEQKTGGKKRFTQDDIYHFLRDRYDIKESLKDIKKEMTKE